MIDEGTTNKSSLDIAEKFESLELDLVLEQH